MYHAQTENHPGVGSRNRRQGARACPESVEPLAKVLTETEFYAFAEKALALPEVKSLLMSAVNAHNATEQKGKG